MNPLWISTVLCTNPCKSEFNRSLTVLSQSGWRRLIDRRNVQRALFFFAGVNDHHLFSSFRFPCRAICLKSHDTLKKERVASLLEKPTDKWPHLWQLVVWSIEGHTVYKKEIILHYRSQRNKIKNGWFFVNLQLLIILLREANQIQSNNTSIVLMKKKTRLLAFSRISCYPTYITLTISDCERNCTCSCTYSRQRKEHISVTIRAWNELARGTQRTKIAWTPRESPNLPLKNSISRAMSDDNWTSTFFNPTSPRKCDWHANPRSVQAAFARNEISVSDHFALEIRRAEK